DLAFDGMRNVDAADGHRAGRRELLVALELTLRQSLAYGLLNFALGSHRQYLEEFPNAGVENVLIHDRLLCWRLLSVEDVQARPRQQLSVPPDPTWIRLPRGRPPTLETIQHKDSISHSAPTRCLEAGRGLAQRAGPGRVLHRHANTNSIA